MKLCVFALACGCTDSPATMPDAALIDAGLSTTCEGACRTTSLAATFGPDMRMLDRAHYGVTRSSAGSTLHVEAARGGVTGCPQESDPPADYVMVLGRVPIPATTAAITSPGSLLDFIGDLLDGPPGATATTVMLTPVAADVCDGCTGILALDAQVTFSGGTVTGHLFATHCDSLDVQEAASHIAVPVVSTSS